MNLEHMRRICGWHCHILGTGKLEDFELGVDLRGYANIRPQKGESIYGVLYEVDKECLESLDRFEGYPTVFGREEIMVEFDGDQKKSWVYIEPTEQFGGNQPKVEYFRRVVSAAEENRLPEEWVAKLKKLMGE
jgi:gamma-glutamylcyclotransferase (GGCT)/AIG2-like uncharacterized protein YtfP